MAFVQEGVPPHKAKATQTWCETNLPNFIEKAEWPVNSPDVNPIESHWSIIDEFSYKDPIPKSMKELKWRFKLAWAISTLRDLSHSMPKQLRNVTKIMGATQATEIMFGNSVHNSSELLVQFDVYIA